MAERKVIIQYEYVNKNGENCFKLAKPKVVVEGSICENPAGEVPKGTAYVKWGPVEGGHVEVWIHTGTVDSDDDRILLKVRNQHTPSTPYLSAVVTTVEGPHPLDGKPETIISPGLLANGAPIKRDLLNDPAKGAAREARIKIEPENGCGHLHPRIDSDVHVEC